MLPDSNYREPVDRVVLQVKTTLGVEKLNVVVERQTKMACNSIKKELECTTVIKKTM